MNTYILSIVISVLFTLLFTLLLRYLYFTRYKENFKEEPDWKNTVKCLDLKNDDINTFHSYIENVLKGGDPDKNLVNLITLLENKGYDYEKIMSCFTS